MLWRLKRLVCTRREKKDDDDDENEPYGDYGLLQLSLGRSWFEVATHSEVIIESAQHLVGDEYDVDLSSGTVLFTYLHRFPSDSRVRVSFSASIEHMPTNTIECDGRRCDALAETITRSLHDGQRNFAVFSRNRFYAFSMEEQVLCGIFWVIDALHDGQRRERINAPVIVQYTSRQDYGAVDYRVCRPKREWHYNVQLYMRAVYATDDDGEDYAVDIRQR